MIEHCTNFCGFIQDCSRLLKKDGTLRLAVPDKRYCFDHYRSTTSIAEILNNAYAPSGIQSAGCVGEYCINVVRRKGSISWNKPVLGVMEHFINRRDKKFDFIHDRGMPSSVSGRQVKDNILTSTIMCLRPHPLSC